MSAAEHLGQQFAGVVADFHSRYGSSYSEPDICVGECSNASDAFENHAYRAGLRGVGTSVYEGDGAGYHSYNTYKGHAVDWTARQFFPQAEVPHIEPERAFRNRLRGVRYDPSTGEVLP